MLDVLYGLTFVVGTVALSFGSYLAARWFASKQPTDRHPEMANAMVARIGALHGLILALVFAQEMGSYQRLETQMSNEASAVADVYNDAARYDPVTLVPLREAMVAYLDVVITTEWPAMGNGDGLVAEAWMHWDAAYNLALNLEPVGARQTSLREHMLSQLHAIATARNLRDTDGSSSVVLLFWFAAISGVILIAVGYYSHRPDRHNLVLMGLFSAYTGIILFLIYGFSNPYSAPAALAPLPLERLYSEIGPGSG